MIVLYRYVKAKREAKKRNLAAATTNPEAQLEPQEHAINAQDSNVPQAPPQAGQAPQGRSVDDTKKLSWMLMIMAALAIPVFLETLDYTGNDYSHTFEVSELMFTSPSVVATAQVHIAVGHIVKLTCIDLLISSKSVFNRLDLQR